MPPATRAATRAAIVDRFVRGAFPPVDLRAGCLVLNIICFYDDNGISIDGEVEGWFSDDTPARFESYGWHVIPNVDGHDSDAIKAAIEEAHAETGKPTLICCKTIIGFGTFCV